MRRRVLLCGVIIVSPGSPDIVVDSSGNIVEWESTVDFELKDGEYVDTGFIPFDGSNFELYIRATFPAQDGTQTLLSAIAEVNPFNGFEIYRSGSSNIIYKYKSKTITLTSGDDIELYISSNDGKITVSGTSNFNYNANYSISGLSINIGKGANDTTSNTNCKIHEFYVRKI